MFIILLISPEAGCGLVFDDEALPGLRADFGARVEGLFAKRNETGEVTGFSIDVAGRLEGVRFTKRGYAFDNLRPVNRGLPALNQTEVMNLGTGYLQNRGRASESS